MWSATAAILLVAGGWLTVVGYRSRSFGWFAGAPLSDQMYEPTSGLLVVARAEAIELVVLTAGLVLGRTLCRHQDRLTNSRPQFGGD